MRQAPEIDLTTTDGEPGLRAEIRFELAADELAARRLRGQVLLEHALLTDSPRSTTAQVNGMPRPLGRAVYRSILAIDIEGSTRRTNSAKAGLRDAMYRLLHAALRAAGVGEHVLDKLVDRGDGALALIRPTDEAPKALLLDTVLPTLLELLIEHNRHHADLALRLRAVVHAGDVHHDSMGWFGEAIDLACRLLDAPALKRKLFQTTGPLVLVVSDEIYRSIVVQGYAGIDRQGFASRVWVRVGEHRHCGWVQVPGPPVVEALLPELAIEPEPDPATTGIA